MTTGTVSPVSAFGSPPHVTSKPNVVLLRLCSQSNPVESTSAPFSNASLSSPTTTASQDFLSTLTTVARIALFTSFVRPVCRRRSHLWLRFEPRRDKARLSRKKSPPNQERSARAKDFGELSRAVHLGLVAAHLASRLHLRVCPEFSLGEPS